MHGTCCLHVPPGAARADRNRTVDARIAASGLPGWKVDLGEWRVLHPTGDVAIVSYKVTGVSIRWKAYATSVWVKRDGGWKTTFYQASTAK